MNYWLMKSEPSTFGIDALAKAPRKRSGWDGVRNYTARNMLRDQMQKGDLAFFYHSSCELPGIYGIARIARSGYPDPTAFKRGHAHFDADSDPKNPRWYMVDVEFVRRLARPISLDALKANSKSLPELLVIKRGNRLSIMPVAATEWRFILTLE